MWLFCKYWALILSSVYRNSKILLPYCILISLLQIPKPQRTTDHSSLFISERKTSSSLTLAQIHIALNFFLVICCFNRTPTTKILTSRHVYIKQVFNHQAHRTCFCRVWKKMTLSVISYFTRHVLYNLLLNANFIFEIENLV